MTLRRRRARIWFHAMRSRIAAEDAEDTEDAPEDPPERDDGDTG